MITHNSLHKFFTLDFLKIKLFLIILLLSFNYNFAQRENLIIEEELIDKTQDLYNLSPDGVLETIFDQYGKKYKLEDIFINALPSNTATLISCSSTSYFNLYLFIASKEIKNIGKAFMTGTSGHQRISLDFLKNYKISIPAINI